MMPMFLTWSTQMNEHATADANVCAFFFFFNCGLDISFEEPCCSWDAGLGTGSASLAERLKTESFRRMHQRSHPELVYWQSCHRFLRSSSTSPKGRAQSV